MSARAQAVMAPRLPQVNLLPPEVKAARGLATIKRWLALAVLASVLVSAGMVAKAMNDRSSADDKLAEQRTDTARLNGLKTQYAEVPLVIGALTRAQDAREIGMSTEVLWSPYVRAVAATAPAGVRIETLRTASATPMLLPAGAADALSAAGVSTVSFTAQALTMPDFEAWLRQLATIPGFSDAWFSQATLTEQDDAIYYNVNALVILTDEGYSRRFSAETLAALAAEEAADAEATEEPAAGDEEGED